MERYSNKGGDSGVIGYQIDGDSILVEFKDRSQYLYNSVKPGPQAVAEMQRLARGGQGLNSYIGRVVRKNFARKVR